MVRAALEDPDGVLSGRLCESSMKLAPTAPDTKRSSRGQQLAMPTSQPRVCVELIDRNTRPAYRGGRLTRKVSSRLPRYVALLVRWVSDTSRSPAPFYPHSGSLVVGHAHVWPAIYHFSGRFHSPS